MEDGEMWKRWDQALQESRYPDHLKRYVYQAQERAELAALPHVLKPLPNKETVMGSDSPHQMGDNVAYDMLTRGPLFTLSSHFSDVKPGAPVRGMHRHISAPTIFCLQGKGWEWNDGHTYTFGKWDLLAIPPYTKHQHGGDPVIYTELYAPQVSRVPHLLGLQWREQHKLNEKPRFPAGTEPIYGADGQLAGYRIKKGVLGIQQDLDVVLGPDPKREEAFEARRAIGEWCDQVTTAYDRYLKMMYDESHLWSAADHVMREADNPWEDTRQGRIKWLIHPDTYSACKGKFMFFQEIPPGLRSGRHRHVAEELIYVLEGRGYDVHDGQRWDWQQGDFICVPVLATHQHFNSDPGRRAVLLSAFPAQYAALGLGGFEQLEDAPGRVMVKSEE